ncbi:MAG: WD40/YVTN/BNR-like repeat-containing protein [Fimbriimonadaceae bacterium]
MFVSLFLALACHQTPIADVDPRLYQELRWRMIGPFRGGRTTGATGIPGHPNEFLIGGCNGGVWKTNDYGRTWKPLFDAEPTGSIGAIAVAPSSPNVLYVGSGEALQRPDLSVGDGMYKSIDGGKHWTHLGLRDSQQIVSVIVDPHNPDRLFVGVLGHPYGPNATRGVYRSLDGGKSFQQVLYKGVDTGAAQVSFDPTDANTIYADMWAARQGPWENGQFEGPGSGLYKSTDGGDTWTHLTGGLPEPAGGCGRIGFGIAPSNPKRLYATLDRPSPGGIYRSDDAGATWARVNTEHRVYGRGDDFANLAVDPTNPDIVYAANTSTYKSVDGGKNFVAWKGAPGGDDYHTVWIAPDNPQTILLASDQGATLTVNGGETWSSWYNQPTAQFYHVATDNQFPYWVYGGQQESGSVGTSSRGNDGQITFREWHPVGAEEYGYVAPDPLHPNLIYGGKLTRYNMITGGVDFVMPPQVGDLKVRFVRTAPLLFSPVDKHALFFAGSRLFKTTDQAKTWQVISPDLTREHPEVPANVGVYTTSSMATMPRRGVIYAIGLSNQDVNTIWAGTDDGLIQRTTDGGATWSDVTPPGLTAWSKVSQLDAGRFSNETCYAAINRLRLDDLHPYAYRTHDGGKTWTKIVDGLPDDPVDAVREDPVRPGLLYAATERAVYFSLDDGDHWHPLRLNMPATSVRDLVIHGDDLVIGTHGRSFWILDDVTPLRQLAGSALVETLFKPAAAYLLDPNTNTDTPLPPEEPGGQNPPDGAMLDYCLASDAANVTLEVLDAGGKVVRKFANTDKPYVVNEKSLQVPMYWVRPARMLSAMAGMHRFIWDMHDAAAGGGRGGPGMAAIVHDTPVGPQGPWAQAGTYTIRLTVDGRTYTQPLTLLPDPRGWKPPKGRPRFFGANDD